MTGRVGHQVISVFVAITILSNFSDCGYCPASAPTVSVVSKCPTNKTEWDQAASRKKCNFMTAKCEDKSPVYHCLLNQWRNETVEVCASTWYISGFCAVYNIDDMKVIDDFQTDCTKFTESKCPSRYISSEAYLYQKCYEKRDLAVTLTDKTQQEINDNTSYIAALVVVILFAIFMGIFLLLTCLGKIPIIVNGRSGKKDPGEEPTLDEGTLLIASIENAQLEVHNTKAEGTIMDTDEKHNSTNDPYARPLQNGERTSSSSNADSDEETKNNEQNKDLMVEVVDNHNSTNVPYSELRKRWERTTSRSKSDCDEGTENNEQSEDLMVEVVDNHNSTNVPYSELQKRWERTVSRSKSDCDEGTENNEKSEEEAKQDKVHLPQRNNVDVSQQNEVNGSQQDEVNGSQQDEVVVSKSERVDGSQQDEVNGSQQDEVVVSKSDRIDASQQIEVDVSQQNEIGVSQQNEANVSHKDEVDQPQQGCVDDSQQILPKNASQQSGVNVLQRRQMFENKLRSPPS